MPLPTETRINSTCGIPPHFKAALAPLLTLVTARNVPAFVIET
jgi:hypothetical protein